MPPHPLTHHPPHSRAWRWRQISNFAIVEQGSLDTDRRPCFPDAHSVSICSQHHEMFCFADSDKPPAILQMDPSHYLDPALGVPTGTPATSLPGAITTPRQILSESPRKKYVVLNWEKENCAKKRNEPTFASLWMQWANQGEQAVLFVGVSSSVAFPLFWSHQERI